jgi:uncharacterized alkaline shock family protein YloU
VARQAIRGTEVEVEVEVEVEDEVEVELQVVLDFVIPLPKNSMEVQAWTVAGAKETQTWPTLTGCRLLR